MAGMVKMTADLPNFDRFLKDRAAIYGRTVKEEFKSQCKFLANELIQRTAPFSGRTINRMLDGRGLPPSVENISAQKIGERAVARDMAKLFLPIKNWWQTKATNNFAYLFSVAGMAFGVPGSYFNASPSREWMQAIRGKFRKRGRITFKGGEQTSGRTTVIKKYPVPELQYEMLETKLKGEVGEAKGGWALAYKVLGGAISSKGWIGRHMKAGTVTHNLDSQSPVLFVTMQNKSSWAAGGDDQRIIDASIKGRAQAMIKDVQFKLDYMWGRKSRIAA